MTAISISQNNFPLSCYALKVNDKNNQVKFEKAKQTISEIEKLNIFDNNNAKKFIKLFSDDYLLSELTGKKIQLIAREFEKVSWNLICILTGKKEL